jgi:hypothetical protein
MLEIVPTCVDVVNQSNAYLRGQGAERLNSPALRGFIAQRPVE